ncbi:sialin-like [Babylonia areolata]|uniref:sialin-like n=1 Tax=Babylonia areolata TaxID=304850 RepID=UPI003FD3F0BF
MTYWMCSERWRLAYLLFIGSFFGYALRVNISVAIVCMVKSGTSTSSSSSNSSNNNTSSNISSNTSNNVAATTVSICGGSLPSSDSNTEGEFDWDKSIQASILSAFFYGYLFLQIPGGWLAGRFGGKKVLGTSLTVVALATVLLPVLARQDYRYVFALRVIMGLASGPIYPSVHALCGRWAPPGERSRITSFSYSGYMIGSISTFIFSGYLCAYGFDNGWGSIFYLTGGTCFLWVAAWFWFVADTPESSRRISEAEKRYIVSSIGQKQERKFQVPWRAMLTSRALWVCLTAQFCNNWMHYTLMTSLPMFMKEVLHYDVKQNGLMSSIPYITMFVVSIIGGHVADFLRAHCISTRLTRRLYQATSFLGSGACLVGVGFVNCEHRTLAVVLLAVAVGFEGLCYSGFMVNHIDFAPRYAGVLYGITNTVSTIPGVVAPEVAGLLTPNRTQEEWRNVFYVCGGFTLLGAIVFGGFAQTDTEPWNSVPMETEYGVTEPEPEMDRNKAETEMDDLESGVEESGTLLASGNGNRGWELKSGKRWNKVVS